MKSLGENSRGKLTSESISLGERESKRKRLSTHSRGHTDPRYSTTTTSGEMYFANTPMAVEGCTCSAFYSRSSLKQEGTRGVKRDACTSPTYPPSNNHANSSKKGSFKAQY